MTSSLVQLSAEFSVLLAAITHFTIAFFQHNKHSQRVNFSGQFLVWLGKFPLGSKLISGGVAIRMSWCAFFEKINSREGTSIPDWRVLSPTSFTRPVISRMSCFSLPSHNPKSCFLSKLTSISLILSVSTQYFSFNPCWGFATGHRAFPQQN